MAIYWIDSYRIKKSNYQIYEPDDWFSAYEKDSYILDYPLYETDNPKKAVEKFNSKYLNDEILGDNIIHYELNTYDKNDTVETLRGSIANIDYVVDKMFEDWEKQCQNTKFIENAEEFLRYMLASNTKFYSDYVEKLQKKIDYRKEKIENELTELLADVVIYEVETLEELEAVTEEEKFQREMDYMQELKENFKEKDGKTFTTFTYTISKDKKIRMTVELENWKEVKNLKEWRLKEKLKITNILITNTQDETYCGM